MKKRNKKIISLRKDGKTYQEIGDMFDITPSRARQIFKKEERAENGNRVPMSRVDKKTPLNRLIPDGKLLSALSKNGVETIGKLSRMRVKNILKIRDIGRKRLDEVCRIVGKYTHA